MKPPSHATAGTRPPSGPGERFPGAGAALLLYALLTVLLTWPLAARLGDALPLGNNDLWQNYWNFWWWKTALLERGAFPYTTDLIYQPGEVTLGLHTHSPANVLAFLPLTTWWNEAAALGIATLAGFLLAGWGTYFLVREIVIDRRASFVAGIFVAFLPQHFEQSLEHINLASYQAMPFYLWFLVRALYRGGTANALLAGVFFALNALYSWHNGLLVVPASLVLVSHALVTRASGRWRLLGNLAVAGCVSALVLLPFVVPLIGDILRADDAYLKPRVAKGIDPLFLFVPPAWHPVWGGLVDGLYARLRAYHSVGFTCYLGIPALALVALGVTRRPRFTRLPPTTLWVATAVVYLVLALGDELVVAGHALGVPLPFRLLRDVPILGTLRVANRFVIPACVMLAVPVGVGCAWALGAHTKLLHGHARFAAVVALLTFDFLAVPYPVRSVPAPGWLEQLAAQPPGLVLNIPGGHRARGSEDMFFQTRHGKPIVGGYTSVVPAYMEERVSDLPFLKLVFEGIPRVEVDTRAGLEEVLAALPIRYVILHSSRERERLERLHAENRGRPEERFYNPHRGLPHALIEEVRDALDAMWAEPILRDDLVTIWRRPGTGAGARD